MYKLLQFVFMSFHNNTVVVLPLKEAGSRCCYYCLCYYNKSYYYFYLIFNITTTTTTITTPTATTAAATANLFSLTPPLLLLLLLLHRVEVLIFCSCFWHLTHISSFVRKRFASVPSALTRDADTRTRLPFRSRNLVGTANTSLSALSSSHFRCY